MAMQREKDRISLVEDTWSDGQTCWKIESVLKDGKDYRFEVFFTLAEATSALKAWLQSDIDKESKTKNLVIKNSCTCDVKTLPKLINSIVNYKHSKNCAINTRENA